jgi:hypothetical protein
MGTGLLYAQDDEDIEYIEDIIVQFPESFAFNLSSKYNMGIFQSGDSSYRTGKPWDIGIGLRYKYLGAYMYIPLKFPPFGNRTSFDIAISFYQQKMYYETFIKRYQRFYTSNNEGGSAIDDNVNENENVGLDIMSSGIMVGYIHNHKNHSLRSVFTLAEKQTASSGSLLYGFGAFYTSIYGNRENEVSHYN